MKLKLNLELDVTQEDIEEIIEMAGYRIGYWADEAIVGENSYDIHDPLENKWFKLTHKDILKGISLYIKRGNKPYSLLGASSNKLVFDLDNLDSTVADVIIQYSCFGEWIYG